MIDLIVLAVVAIIVLPALFKTIKKFSKKSGKGHDHDCGGGCGCGCC